MAILKIQNLTKAFDGIKAVNNLSFEVDEKTIVGLIGPNGSGKTTVFNLISGFQKPDGGSVLLDERPITSLGPTVIARCGMGRTFQNIRLFPQLSALDNVMLGLGAAEAAAFWPALLQIPAMKMVEKENRQKAAELLKSVGLSEKQDASADKLSHGQRKLLELTLLRARNPRLLLLDEPFAGLFPEAKKKMLASVESLKGAGKTILFIEHDLNSVMAVADKIIVLAYGQKIAEGPPEEIRRNEKARQIYLGQPRV